MKRGRIPHNESKASWTIKCMNEAPASAQHHPSLHNGFNYEVGRQRKEDGFVAFCDSVQRRLMAETKAHDHGRPAGSRIVEDPITGEFKLIIPN